MNSRILFLCLILLMVWGCKDPCKDVECQNGGVCNDGVCECPDGVAGDNCEYEPCDYTICQNGGVCVNGDCHCPDHYLGETCLVQEEPSLICPTRFEVVIFPDSGSSFLNWIGPDGAEIEVRFFTLDSTNSYLVLENVSSDSLPRSIDLNLACMDTSFWVAPMQFVVSDSSESWHTNVDWECYSPSNGFPEYVEFGDEELLLRLYLDYEWF